MILLDQEAGRDARREAFKICLPTQETSPKGGGTSARALAASCSLDKTSALQIQLRGAAVGTCAGQSNTN